MKLNELSFADLYAMHRWAALKQAQHGYNDNNSDAAKHYGEICMAVGDEMDTRVSNLDLSPEEEKEELKDSYSQPVVTTVIGKMDPDDLRDFKKIYSKTTTNSFRFRSQTIDVALAKQLIEFIEPKFKEYYEGLKTSS